MITVILETHNLEQLDRTSESSNAQYLIQANNPKYKYLSQLSEVDYDIFASEDMPGLIQDLLRLKKSTTHSKQLKHIADIIHLAKRCHITKDVVLVFTPWGEE
jgi:ABC-type enterochelin transport system substrate-binding protein